MYRVDWAKASICLIVAIFIGLLTWWALHVATPVPQTTATILAAVIAGVLAVTQMFLTHAISKGTDLERLELFRTAFDRPAFRNSFANEASEEDFFVAISDTIRALNTGVLLDRKTQQTLQRADGGKGTLKKFRKELDDVVKTLEDITDLYTKGK